MIYWMNPSITLYMPISWKRLLYNKFRFGLHPSMLSQSGYIKKLVCKIDDDLKAEPREILFDNEYVKQYIHKTIVSRLTPEDLDKIIELLENAKKI